MAKNTVQTIVVFDRFDEVLEQMTDEVNKAMQQTAREIRDAAKSKVPVRTGDLRDSIKFGKEDDGKYAVYSRQFYAVWVEYGTVRASAHPYMTPAAEAARSVFEKRIQVLINEL